jgi:formamidopyrimidine-DNA glycosylase
MPELPEVETTRRGLLPHVVGRSIRDVVVRNPNLRWPVPKDLKRRLRGERVRDIRRRGKYLLFGFPRGHLLVHLGMSGRLTVVPASTAPRKHDHVDLVLDDGKALRFNDARRFGTVLWVDKPEEHALLRNLGLEPLDESFDGKALAQRAKGRSVRREAVPHERQHRDRRGQHLRLRGAIPRRHPSRATRGRISAARWDRLARSIRTTLESAIDSGGSTLRDFVSAEGRPGYFQHSHAVYGREGKACPTCRAKIRSLRQGQRSTFFCPGCQK